jgi:hypothetical protein
VLLERPPQAVQEQQQAAEEEQEPVVRWSQGPVAWTEALRAGAGAAQESLEPAAKIPSLASAEERAGRTPQILR